MNSFLFLSAIFITTIKMQAQESQLPPSLTLAAKEGLQKLEEQKQRDIAFFAKNNTPNQEASAPENNTGNFYQLYIRDEDNRYYNNYHNNNTDPVLTNMPSPGPNLDYYYIDPCSSGNYDKVVKQ